MARLARRRAGIRRSKTAVWYERTRVGTLTKATDGGVAFSYDPGWLASDMAFPVASVLPLTQADWKGDPVIAAFDNLLPDAVKAGAKVKRGDTVAVMEAMKMEHALPAPRDGVVESVSGKPGAQVAEGDILVQLVAE